MSDASECGEKTPSLWRDWRRRRRRREEEGCFRNQEMQYGTGAMRLAQSTTRSLVIN